MTSNLFCLIQKKFLVFFLVDFKVPYSTLDQATQTSLPSFFNRWHSQSNQFHLTSVIHIILCFEVSLLICANLFVV